MLQPIFPTLDGSTPVLGECSHCGTIRYIWQIEYIHYLGSTIWHPVCPECAEPALLADEQGAAVAYAARIIRRYQRRLAKAGAL